MRRNRYKRRKTKKSKRIGQYLGQGLQVTAAFLGVVILSVALVTGHDFLIRCQYFSATTIQVNGLNRLTKSEVLKKTQLKKGVNILAVNLSLIRKRLMVHPWIADASVRRRLPDALELRVTEQVPLAVVDLGRKFVINQQGTIFKKAESSDENNLPVIMGLSYADLNLADSSTGSLFGSVLAVLRLGSEPGSAIPNAILQAVRVDREIGLTLVAFEQPLVIRLGYQNYPAKYEVLTQLLAHYDARQAALGIDWIDLNDPKRIVMNLKGELTQKKEKEV